MSIKTDIYSQEYTNAALRFKVNERSCENPDHYNAYLWQNAILDQKTGMGVTHVFVDEKTDGEIEIAGFVALRASSLVRDMGEKHKFGYSALEIAELAVNRDYERAGIGSSMVKFAIAMADKLNRTILGCKYVLVCADPDAVDFYRKSGFQDISPYVDSIPREHWNINCVPMLMRITE